MYNCIYCDKTYENLKSSSQHIIRCPNNPNKLNMDFSKTEKSIFYRKNISPQVMKEYHKNKKWEMINKTKICKNCNNSFIYKEEEFVDKHSDFCSLSCSKTRKHSFETKLKISNTNKSNHPINCFVCKNEINWNLKKTKLGNVCTNCFYKTIIKRCCCCKNKFELYLGTYFNTKDKINLYCSKICFWKVNSYIYEKISKTRKERYKLNLYELTGGHSKRFYYKEYKVQGSFEYRACFILDYLKEIWLIESWEYTKDSIIYIWLDNKEHSYFLDFKIYNTNKTFTYLETKWFKTELDSLKWLETKKQGYDLIVWFEQDLMRLETLFLNKKYKWFKNKKNYG